MKDHAVKLFAFITLLFSLPSTVFAWTPLGHMVIATIAYEQLKPAVREKVDNLIVYMHQQYPDINSLAWAAAWPDLIRGQKIETYTHWHYTDVSFSTDGSALKNLKDTDNAVYELRNIMTVTKNEKANPYERTRFLAFLAHIVGDLHQPLHTVSNITANLPEGDRGGNSTYVRYKNARVSLHKLWDDGVGTFEHVLSRDEASRLARDISAHYPPTFFAEKVSDVDPENWLKEGMELAKQNVYNTPFEQAPVTQYIESGRQIAEQRVALAGYRLAAILNLLLADPVKA